MKKAGVPVTPAASPAAMSVSTSFGYLRESTHALKLGGVQPELGRMLLQVLVADSFLGICEQAVVVLPELALLVRACRGLGRGPRVRVVRQRVVTVGETDAVAVGVQHLR